MKGLRLHLSPFISQSSHHFPYLANTLASTLTTLVWAYFGAREIDSQAFFGSLTSYSPRCLCFAGQGGPSDEVTSQKYLGNLLTTTSYKEDFLCQMGAAVKASSWQWKGVVFD